ncbi:putative phenylalanine--tRNA ligase beta subunit [Morella rubra]|uniref:phenylalanine--tRNA ligase n=1 Tax=Morella rubra TaxID=262757 RepID=A0A6A1VJD8_9ROSI|nr:putative phenylalanine--tRNA ligase beta subunit [Morella rubra]
MPTVSVGRDRLFAALGKTYTKIDGIVLVWLNLTAKEEFEDLCFRFGIELDDVTTEKAIIRKEKHLDEEEVGDDEEVIYKIEVPANRYDLLCLEGIAQALRIFNGQQEMPTYKLASISRESMIKMHVKPETSSIRPYIVCAVIRGVTFDEASYNSFIDLQDKLHQNICRRRTLVAIGTHDLDTLRGPFTYEALPPSSINFVPLKQVKNFRADELMEFYKSDLKLKKFLHIIEDSPVFPVLYDSNRTVLSLPPIINGARSAITLKTKNVFIECTATDLTKAKIVLNMMATTFSEYCERKFEIEPVEVIYSDGKSYIYPDISIYNMEVSLSYITGAIGVSLEADEVTSLLNRMQLRAEKSVSGDNDSNITVSVPPIRSDVLHPCDVMEDVAIAYGYDNVKDITIAKGYNITKGRAVSLKPLRLEEFSHLIRLEMAMCGFTEVLSFILCSQNDNFAMLNHQDDRSTAVIIENPRSSENETARTSLMPGILKTVGQNKAHPKPIKIFEVGDIVLLDETNDVGAINRRQLAALYCGATAGYEIIHGLVERVMQVIGLVAPDDNTTYYLKPSDEPEFLRGTQASIIYKGKQIGTSGIVHPEKSRKSASLDIDKPL